MANIFQESLPILIDMFPERSFKFLKERLSGWKGSLPDLIDSILNSPEDSDDDDSGVSMNETSADLNVNASIDSTYLDNTAGSVEVLIPEPGPSTSREDGPVNYIEKNFATLSSLFPEVSPIYLQEKAWTIGNEPEKLEEFISRAFEDKSSLPLKKDEKKVENKQLQVEKVKKLTARDFVAEFEDPHAHYRDTTRRTSVLYKDHVKFYLKKHFTVHHSKLKKIIEENSNLLYPCLKELETLDKGKGKGKGKTADSATNLQRPVEMDLEFLKEYIYYKLEDKIRGLQDFRSKRRAAEITKAKAEGGLFECLVCYDDECLLTEVVMCDSGCMFCPTCTRRGSEVQIGENKSNINCPLTCGAEIPLSSLQKHLSTKLYSKLIERKQLAEIEAAGLENLVQCPGCNYAVIVPAESQDKVIICGNPECGRQTCRQCGEESHIPLTCDEVEKDSEVKARTKVEDAMTEAMLRECPNAKCKKKYFKEEGCNKMTCTCGQSMCYLCRKPVGNDYKHFFGQGATPKAGLCPLWSNVSKLHTDEITNAANKAKESVGKQLKHDPSKNIKKPKDYHKDPGAFENAVFEETDSDDDDFDEDDEDLEDEDDEDIPNEDDILFIYDDSDNDDDGHGHYRLMDW